MNDVFRQIVDKRRACREFDTTVKVPETLVKSALENALKAPNSSNMQLWEFYRIKDAEALKRVAAICLHQSGAETASEIVVFVARPDLWKQRQAVHLKRLEHVPTKDIKNKLFNNSEYTYYKDVMRLFYDTRFAFFRDIFKRIYIWNKRRKTAFMTDILSKDVAVVAQKSVALAAQTFMLSIAAEGYDSLPMEGLDAVAMKKFLGLPRKAAINMAIAVGKATPDGIRGERFRLPYNEVVFTV